MSYVLPFQLSGFLSPVQAWNSTPHLSWNAQPLLSHWTNRNGVFRELTNGSNLYRKGPAAIKYDKSAHSPRYEIMLAAACFCVSLNQECLLTRGGQCGGFHHFWPELILTPLFVILKKVSLFIHWFTVFSLLFGSGSGDVRVMMVNSLLIPQWSVHTALIVRHHYYDAGYYCLCLLVSASLTEWRACWLCLIKMDQDNTGYCYIRVITRPGGIYVGVGNSSVLWEYIHFLWNYLLKE